MAVPDSTTDICYRAFDKCASLKSVRFGERSRLKWIESHAFEGTALRSFAAPSALREIGEAAFCGCVSLK